mgnify:CR=1 FL=1
MNSKELINDLEIHARASAAAYHHCELMANAAAHIAAQDARIEALQGALLPFAREARLISTASDLGNKSWKGTGLSYQNWWDVKAALGGEQHGG